MVRYLKQPRYSRPSDAKSLEDDAKKQLPIRAYLDAEVCSRFFPDRADKISGLVSSGVN